ncbi:hypothetical protein CYMTET_31821 [Cymbomonas tetramitiformis]|uniref:Uncharacterized protein n=1 Tax=Cymbomonas tetramitiformis TaxID=36881 RepID=A0AAE0FH13_9CHLO|nr:hypothetical protein CYMTET_31821 [Cymbomonas tetramitiformis]
MNIHAYEYVPDAHAVIIKLEAQNVLMRELLGISSTARTSSSNSYERSEIFCTRHGNEAGLASDRGTQRHKLDRPSEVIVKETVPEAWCDEAEIQREAICRITGTQTASPGYHGVVMRDVGRTFWAWKGRTSRWWKDATGRDVRIFKVTRTGATLARILSAWIAVTVRANMRIVRVSRALHRWRGVTLQDNALRIQTKEANMKECEDDNFMLTQINHDLQLALDALRVELREQTVRLENSRGTNTELLKRLRVSDECITSMRKDYKLRCSQCKGTVLQIKKSADAKSESASYSFVTSENAMDDEAVDVVSKFTDL